MNYIMAMTDLVKMVAVGVKVAVKSFTYSYFI